MVLIIWVGIIIGGTVATIKSHTYERKHMKTFKIVVGTVVVVVLLAMATRQWWQPVTPTNTPTTTTSAPAPLVDPSEADNVWCEAYVAWWNTPEGSAEEEIALGRMTTAGGQTTSPESGVLIARWNAIASQEEYDAWMIAMDGFCGVTVTPTGEDV